MMDFQVVIKIRPSGATGGIPNIVRDSCFGEAIVGSSVHKRDELKGLVVVACRFLCERGACGGATSAAERGLAGIAYLGLSARFRATRSRCILHCRSRSRRIGMTSSSVAEPFATIPIMMNRYLLGR